MTVPTWLWFVIAVVLILVLLALVGVRLHLTTGNGAEGFPLDRTVPFVV
jgi:hypothetical protein